MSISGLPGAPLASTIVVAAVIVALLGARATELFERATFGSGEQLRASKKQSLGLVVAMLPRQYVRALRAGTRAWAHESWAWASRIFRDWWGR